MRRDLVGFILAALLAAALLFTFRAAVQEHSRPAPEQAPHGSSR